MFTKKLGLWGYDPGVTLRYAQFITFTQGGDPDKAPQDLNFRRYDKLYNMLRCKYIITKKKIKGTKFKTALRTDKLFIYEVSRPLPRLMLVENWFVETNRDRIFSKMVSEKFNPEQMVILEEPPFPKPKSLMNAGKAGRAEIVESSTDHLIVHAELSRPAILVISDGYHSGWRVKGTAESIHQKYHLLPANYVLMAVPLDTGKHELLIEYSPWEFRVGIWISILSFIFYLAICLLIWKKEKILKIKTQRRT
jgi:uncharacterized membrane protein YfhO